MTTYLITAKSKVTPIPGSKSPFKNIYKEQGREIRFTYKVKNADEWINSYIFVRKGKKYISCHCLDVGEPKYFTKEGSAIPAEWVEPYIQEPTFMYGAAFQLEDVKVIGIKRDNSLRS